MIFDTLENTKLEEILNVFNYSFSDYFIPFKLSKEQLISKMEADETDLNLSVGVFEKGHLVAFILHGIDKVGNENVAYNGGTGVIPEQRGKGLTLQMYRFIIPLLLKKGIDRVILEVIDKNIPAIKSYKKSGFKLKRSLVCFRGTAKTTNWNQHIEVKQLQNYNWKLMRSFWDILPTWQNSINVTSKLRDHNVSLGAYSDNALVGYVIYNPNNQRIQQIAVQREYRNKKTASALIHKLTNTYGDKLSIINVDKKSLSAHHFLLKLGLEISLEQLEMELDLKNESLKTGY